MTQTKWKLIGRGWAGWHASAVNTTSSGGDLLPYTYWTGKRCSGYAQEAEEGCPIYDASETENNPETNTLFYRLIVSGPMISHKLHDQGPDAYVDAKALDFIPKEEFLRRLRRIPGVKFGHIHHGSPVWE